MQGLCFWRIFSLYVFAEILFFSFTVWTKLFILFYVFDETLFFYFFLRFWRKPFFFTFWRNFFFLRFWQQKFWLNFWRNFFYFYVFDETFFIDKTFYLPKLHLENLFGEVSFGERHLTKLFFFDWTFFFFTKLFYFFFTKYFLRFLRFSTGYANGIFVACRIWSWI